MLLEEEVLVHPWLMVMSHQFDQVLLLVDLLECVLLLLRCLMAEI